MTRVRFSAIHAAVPLVLLLAAIPSLAEEKIQAVLTTSGRIVFTNMVVDNTPAPPAPIISERTDVLAEEIPTPMGTLVEVISVNHGVDPALVRAVIKTESNFNRWAVSPKGARGLMQLIPETGRRYGVQDFFDPKQNVEGGVQYLKFLLEKFNGNLDLSLAAYNAGENLVERLGRIPPIAETTNYVRRVRANYVKKPSSIAASPLLKPAVQQVAQQAVQQPAAQPPAQQVAPAQQPVKQAKEEPSSIYKTVDGHGVVHFSNIGPPN
jgi:soluble lytic murein transglycosylase-like protein